MSLDLMRKSYDFNVFNKDQFVVVMHNKSMFAAAEQRTHKLPPSKVLKLSDICLNILYNKGFGTY